MAEIDYLAIAMNNDNWKMWMLKWVHDIAGGLGATSDGTTPTAQEIVALPPVTKAFGAITNAYVALGFITAGTQVTGMFLKNTTDSDIALSLNGVTQWETVSAGEERMFNFGAGNRVLKTDPRVKYLGAAPTIGELYVSGYN